METAGITIYHNGICSKSKGALELLQDGNIPHQVRYYLIEPLTLNELETLLQKLGMQPSALVRKSEPLYMEQYAGKAITEQEWLHILTDNPILIERPIVANETMAVVARPAERIFEVVGDL